MQSFSQQTKYQCIKQETILDFLCIYAFLPPKASIFGIFAPHFSVSDAPLHKKHPSLLHEVRGEDYKNKNVCTTWSGGYFL